MVKLDDGTAMSSMRLGALREMLPVCDDFPMIVIIDGDEYVVKEVKLVCDITRVMHVAVMTRRQCADCGVHGTCDCGRYERGC